jgi:PleD family two-component response regulator
VLRVQGLAHRSGAAINGSGGPHQFGDNFFTYRKGVLIPVTVVVENDPWIRLVMCDLLAQAGYRVAEASTGFSALRLAHREPLALVLLDLVLPERSVLSVLAELRAAPATAHRPGDRV